MDDAAADSFDDALPLRMGPEELVDDRYLLDTFLENTPDHVYFKDNESRFIRISRALADWLRLEDSADAIGRTDFDFFGEEHARKAFADEQHLMRTGELLIAIEERETWDDGPRPGYRRRRSRSATGAARKTGLVDKKRAT